MTYNGFEKLNKFAFVGSKKQGLRCLQKLYEHFPRQLQCVLTIDDRTDTRSQYDEIAAYCRENGITLHTCDSRRNSEEVLIHENPYAVFVCGWYWLFPLEILTAIRLGVFGIHNSLLPKYRGQAPLVWSLLNGDPEIGATFFRLVPGTDNGDIYHQWRIRNDDCEYIGPILSHIEDLIASKISEIWARILAGTANSVPQNDALATYSCKRGPEDGQIDWSQPAAFIHRFIRTLNHPYPLSYTTIKGKRLFIESAEIFPRSVFGIPGSVLSVENGGAVVACGGQRAIKITKGVLDGGINMNQAGIVAGNRLK